MYPQKMRRMTSMLFSIVLLLIIGELFILPTDATFYIEVTDKTVNNAKISLYECHAKDAHSEHRVLRKAKSSKTQVSRKPQSPQNDEDVTCEEVKNRQHKKKVYSMTNFFMVVDTILDGGKRIYIPINGNGKKGSQPRMLALGNASPTLSIFVGVIIMRSMYDVPKLETASENPDVIKFLHSEVEKVPLIANSIDVDRLREFLLFLGMENYARVLKPKDEDIEQFKVFGEVVKQVEETYARDVRDAKKNGGDRQKIMAAEEQVASASRFLIQKLVDPCLFLGGTRDVLNAEKTRKAAEHADNQCDIYCRFLAAAFKTNRVTSSKCNGNRDTLVYGECYIFRCYCELESYMMGLPEPEKYFTMVECSNDLRIKTAAAVLKTPGLSTLSSIRQSFSRSRPASLWRSRSNGGDSSNGGSGSNGKSFENGSPK